MVQEYPLFFIITHSEEILIILKLEVSLLPSITLRYFRYEDSIIGLRWPPCNFINVSSIAIFSTGRRLSRSTTHNSNNVSCSTGYYLLIIKVFKPYGVRASPRNPLMLYLINLRWC